MTIYNSFVRPHLDYGDIIFDEVYNAPFQQKVESFQYHAALSITGAIPVTSKENLFEELGLEPLQHRRWCSKLCCFYKIVKGQSPKYLFNVIPKLRRPYSIINANNIAHFKVKHNLFKSTLFPSVSIEWNKLDLGNKNAPSLKILLKSPTTDPPTTNPPIHRPLSTYPPTHRPLTHRLIDLRHQLTLREKTRV